MASTMFRFLLRLVELELLDRERRVTERRIREADCLLRIGSLESQVNAGVNPLTVNTT